jgi:hypothetical protein
MVVLIVFHYEITTRTGAETRDGEDALTPAHFLCSAKLTALPSPKTLTCNESLKKTHQRTAKAANDF